MEMYSANEILKAKQRAESEGSLIRSMEEVRKELKKLRGDPKSKDKDQIFGCINAALAELNKTGDESWTGKDADACKAMLNSIKMRLEGFSGTFDEAMKVAIEEEKAERDEAMSDYRHKLNNPSPLAVVNLEWGSLF